VARPVALYYTMLCYQPESLECLHRHFEVVELPDPASDTGDILSRVEVLFAPLGYPVGRDKIDRCPRLRVIASNTTGHPHIDVACARAKGIAVACLKDEHAFLRTITPTAEHSFGLILALTRNLVPAHRSVLNGAWNRRPFGAPAMLSRMSLGIIGLGRLGTLVAGYGRAFGMTVRYFDPYVAAADASIERMPTLTALVSASDVVSLHVPHEPDTEGMIGGTVFDAFRPGSWFINTARGELVDFPALLRALESGRLAGAALDVFEDEFTPGFAARLPQHPLLAYARTHDNLILTPHIGGSTRDAWSETERHTIGMALRALGMAEGVAGGPA
jgi:D-3-phosphoglycerate dehydrogenase